MTRWTIACALALTAHAMAPAAPAATAQDAELPRHDLAQSGAVSRVVVYPRRAAVTRTLEASLAQGLWTVRVSGLPEGIDRNALQAKVIAVGDAASEPRMMGVEYAETPGIAFQGSPEGVELQKKIEELQKRIERNGQDLAQVQQQDKLVDQVGARAAANATAEAGSAKQDIDQVAKQLAWVHDEKVRLNAAYRTLAEGTKDLQRQLAVLQAEAARTGGAARVDRAALVQLAAPTATKVKLEVTYVVDNAAWGPSYAVRAGGDRGAQSVSVEYDAVVAQATGEDWNDVQLSLSTAEPTRASTPPGVAPVYVDVWQPPVPRVASSSVAPMRRGAKMKGEGGPGGRPTGGGFADPGKDRKPGAPGEPGGDNDGEAMTGSIGYAGLPADKADAGIAIEAMAAQANISEAGVAATFAIPRTVTIPSDRAKTQRTRIATIEPTARFAYAAQPLVTESVFLRADLANASTFQLLPGDAQLFMGGDFIGATRMPNVAPKGEFQVFFGPDRAVRAVREIVAKNTGTSGLFGGSATTTWNMRIRIDNGTGRAIDVEVLDRRPVSRSDKVEIKLADLSAPLSTKPSYVDSRQPQGILRWDVAVPAAARGDRAFAITWTVQASRPKDVQTTALPD